MTNMQKAVRFWRKTGNNSTLIFTFSKVFCNYIFYKIVFPVFISFVFIYSIFRFRSM
ncbi:hypothetical protein MCHI_000575 [Candidatus Magnetoovum chiemensis]|nr:hypothetical protein MCHI_000575 [Candidatus Magnetoovum chiemensis]